MDTSSIFLIAIVIIVLIIFGGLLMLKLTIERALKNVKVKPEHMSSAKASGKYTEFYNDHEDIPYNCLLYTSHVDMRQKKIWLGFISPISSYAKKP